MVTPKIYYNDNDKSCCAWLKELMHDGLIPKGEIDQRSITEVRPEDLRGYHQYHFFCGVAGWPLAIRLAAWPEDREVWARGISISIRKVGPEAWRPWVATAHEIVATLLCAVAGIQQYLLTFHGTGLGTLLGY